MTRLRVFIVSVMLLLCGLPVLAQQTGPAQADDPPDYEVNIFNYIYSQELFEISINFGVSNNGGDALTEARVELYDITDPEAPIETITLAPIAGGDEIRDGRISFPVGMFPPQSQQVLRLLVLVEGEDPMTILDNEITLSLTIPDYDPSLIPTPAGQAEARSVYVIPVLELEIPTDNPERFEQILLGLLLVLALGLLLIVIVRIIFRRPPAFGNWQPPYASMPPLDPNSTYGRRQAWQQHAQHNVVPSPCHMGTIYARKVLLGMDGRYLSGWQITSVRMTQYDMYGRVSRSQVLAPAGMVKRLDRTARKHESFETEKLAKRVRPVARNLARQFNKKINARSAMLPIALDVRFQGTHGEIRILFELYECRSGQPVKLDYWEPEMTVLGKTIYESYTFTVYGQAGGESFKEFKKRLSGDIERVLVDMLRVANTSERPSPPDTLSGTQPTPANGEDRAVDFDADTQTS